MISDGENQNDEVLVLESIYNDEELVLSKNNSLCNGVFYARPSLSPDYLVIYRNLNDAESNRESIQVSHLPPINLKFELPCNYPSQCAPKYIISCQWLSVLHQAKLCRRLDEIWDDNHGTAVLFNWFSFLKDESLEYLGFCNSLDVSIQHSQWLCMKNNGQQSDSSKLMEPQKFQHHFEADSDLSTISIDVYCDKIEQCLVADVIGFLKVYNDDRTILEFQRAHYACDICYESVLGRDCTKFQPCEHVFCNECVCGFFKARIEGNQVLSMPCLADGCKSEASQRQVKEAVGVTLFERYDTQLLSASLDAMGDIMRCPRRDCGIPVVIEREERMAVCPTCKAAFCSLCRRTFHGVNPCPLDMSQKKALADEYSNADPETAAALEARYGRRQLQALLSAVRSDEWIEKFTKACPDCKTSIEKAEGCNKVICSKCNLSFCWLCLARLNPLAPYSHFNDPSSPCAGSLFQGMETDHDDDDNFVLDYNWDNDVDLDDDDDDSDPEFIVF